MNTKTLEIRDRGTCIPVLAIQMLPDSEPSRYWLNRCGYPQDGSSIMVMRFYDGRATNDPYEWGQLGLGQRTMQVAHKFIITNWYNLNDGDMVDVEFILGETAGPKASESCGAFTGSRPHEV